MSTVKHTMIIERLRRAHMIELLNQGKRLDDRGLLDYRELKIKTGVVEKANGSALVSLGNTQVMVGVKVEVGTPFPDTPDKGLLVVNAEVLPLASPYAEPGPPDENAIELARVVDRGVRESEMIDLSKLCLIPGEKVYAVFADVSILDVDGNLFDASSYGVVAALASATMPLYEVKDGNLEPTGEVAPLPVNTLPVSITMARIGEVIVLDPTAEEEAVMDARLTLVTDSEGNLCAGQKGGAGTFTPAQILEAAELALRKGEEIRAKIREAVEGGKA
jgi:exosome complex component RRP42